MKKNLSMALTLILLPFAFSSCSNDEDNANGIKIQNSRIELVAGENGQIVAKSNLELNYLPEDTFYVSVDNTGNIMAKRIGETKIMVKNAETTEFIDVVVTPKYTTFPDPYLKFGATKYNVITELNRPYSEAESSLYFDEYTERVSFIGYHFNGVRTLSKLKYISFVFKEEDVEEMIAFLSERYIMTKKTVDVGTSGIPDMIIWAGTSNPNSIDPSFSITVRPHTSYRDTVWDVLYESDSDIEW